MSELRKPALGRLRWEEPQAYRPMADAKRRFSVERKIDLEVHAPRRVTLAKYLTTNRIPRWPGAASALEEAEGLLRAAAEIEHALLVQYIYAGYFLGPSADGMREIFVDIARQEMAHLMTVNNLLLLLGKRPHFYRDVLLPGSAFDPLPFALLPPSVSRMADIVAIEAPDVIALEKASPNLAKRLRAALAKSSTPAEPNRVGALYAVIEWLFMCHGTAAPEPGLPDWEVLDADLHADSKSRQASTHYR